ncbi:leucine--tRNA ligase [Cyanobacterium aponinum UTEX 3221]|uniref:leucine--tRNA ligase n=1 Tax=Cyanobacterium aponinum TaxID=379064 RepID=UPI002B4BED58|nr:leucine--tRNA ligase [Cyanobacterium aponinum]WRL40186.1 leucine--tRNA ligase [Cyanobacterium aponinum UTEX 3221]
MQSPYQPSDIESKWQQQWSDSNLYLTEENRDKPKFYALSMFPYPSGKLHMGHVRNYVITDVIARFKRMQGHRVLHPMGWDAFGLPAENAAIDRGIPPAKWTYENIAQMRSQLQELGLSIDWSREVATCSPDYYKWTQWLFLQFYEAGLAYQKEAAVNWDPIDQTVLANEQVDSEGYSWRSGAKVERKLLRQWFLKITDYAEQLLNDLQQLEGWPDRVKTMQENWIGKSVGAYLEFPIVGSDEKIPVFTTRPDTVYGVTYVVLAPEHPLTEKATTPERKEAVSAFIQEVSSESEIDRTADDKPKKGTLTGGKAINPFTGEEIPILIANYVLYEYGTGAVMGVPAHDGRDFKFAKENNLPIKVVILPENVEETDFSLVEAYTETGIMVNSGEFNGMESTQGKEAVIKLAENKGFGKKRIQYRLRDWLISRQRYWGCPIPVIHCQDCGTVPVPTEQLPVELPEQVEFSGRGPSPLAKLDDWVNVTCPKCDKPAKRETDTMDTFIDSSWYFLRYTDATNQNEPFNLDRVNDWMGVDQYVGGIEHAILHLLYSRFFTKVVRDRGLVSVNEPFKRLLTQGMVQGLTYKTKQTGKYLTPEQIIYKNGECRDKETNEPVNIFYEKMSKSKYNGVDPKLVLEKYGADTARMFILFKAPPEKDLEWDDADVEGQYRFLNRVWLLVNEFIENPDSAKDKTINKTNLSKEEKDLRRAIHTAIKEISEDLSGDYQFNTAVSELMKLSNALRDAKIKNSPVYREGVETLILLLAPFAPHISEELWHKLGNSESVHLANWLIIDEEALTVDEITLVIQIKGKTRGTISAPASASKDELEAIARASDIAQKYIADKEIKKVIVVPNKLVNFVVV